MKSYFAILLLLTGLISCTSQDNPTVTDQPAVQADSINLALIDRFPRVVLPYHWNEMALQNTNYSNMILMEKSNALRLFHDADTNKTHYAVAHLLDTLSYQAVVILESYIDTLLNVSDQYYLITFDSIGKPKDQIQLAANVIGAKHFKITGHVFPDGNVTTEKYTYEFTGGQWVRSDHAIKSVYYRIQPDGTIEEVHSEVDLDEENGDNNIMSELLPLRSRTALL